MLLYIHGFNSSPLSEKGVITADFIRSHYSSLTLYQPQLASSPKEAMASLCAIVEEAQRRGLPLRYIGSSLGGYFASYLAEKYGGKAVLVNPAVKPYELFDEFMGWQHNPYTEEDYLVVPQHKVDLIEFDTSVITHPDRFLVLLQTADEVLDYRQALNKYHCCKMLLQSGGNHSFVGYEEQLQSISHFLRLP